MIRLSQNRGFLFNEENTGNVLKTVDLLGEEICSV